DFKTLRIRDYSDEELRANMNPFAAVMLIAKEALLKAKGTKEEKDQVLLEQKELMVKLLKERADVYGEKKTSVIMSFLNNYVAFQTPEINRIFTERTDKIFGKENTMG